MLELKGVSVTLGKKTVVQNINFSLAGGQSLAIIGPNGSGKTTLLKSIANIVTPSGQVLLDNELVRGMDRRCIAKKFALLNQNAVTTFNYTVKERVLMGRYAYGDSHKNSELAIEMLKLTGMEKYADTSMLTLSGGQAQRVHLAAALAQNAKVIMLDEPTNHLDIKYQIEIIDFLVKNIKGKILIGVFHDINMAMYFSENILIMKDGQVVAQGNAGHVRPLLNKVYDVNVCGFMLESLKRWG